MNVNGKEIGVRDMTYEQVGAMLNEASPRKDGHNLRVVLTTYEEDSLTGINGMTTGYTLCVLVADALRASGGEPTFGYSYDAATRTFMTTPTDKDKE